MKVLVLSMFIAAVVLPSVSAYKCYDCNTAVDGTSCNVPSQSTATCETSTGETCATITGQSVMVRNCFPNTSNVNGCVTFNEGGLSGTMCFCSTNLCNGATTATQAGNTAVRVFLPNGLIVITSAAVAIKLFAGRFF